VQLEVRLLGQFDLHYNGQQIMIPSRPAQSLLAYLALNAGISHRREKLAGLFWPETTEANARGYLRKALWLIRKSFEDAGTPWQVFLQIDEIAICFKKTSSYWLDADFIRSHKDQQAWAIEDLTHIGSLYLGELLPGFYDEWIVVEREGLQICFDQKIRLLLDRLIREHCWEDVLEWGERWIAHGNTPELAYRALMIAHAGIGDRAGITTVYHRVVENLEKELGTAPSVDLQETYKRLLNQEAQAEFPGSFQPAVFEPVETTPTPGEPPYKGLEHFDVNDEALFFGRETLTTRLVAYVQNHQLLAVIGASGSGKSSLLRAGLIPALYQELRDPKWRVEVITPTEHPLESLEAIITNQPPNTSKFLMEMLSKEPDYLVERIQQAPKKQAESEFLLVIDQFEEIFTLCKNEAERKCYIDQLVALLEVSPSTRMVIALRADFYAHCADYPDLTHLLARNQEYIGPMNLEEIRRAIEQPARQNGWDFQPGLVDLLLREIRDEPGALPLLSHALLETWQRRSGRTMTLKGYAESGGVRGAIAKTADRVFHQRLTAHQQILARNIFLRLTELGEETQDTRRRVDISELVSNPGSLSGIQEVLDILAEARLITLSQDSAEVAHEALIREWPVLRHWLAEDRQGLVLHRHLTEAAQEWEAMDRDEGELYRGARLVQALDWAASHSDHLNLLEQNFLEASRNLADRENIEREKQRQQELEAAHKLAEVEQQRAEEQTKTAARLKIRSFMLASLFIIAVILGSAALFAWRQSVAEAAANHSLLLANSAQQLNQVGRGDLALALALESIKMKNPPEEALRLFRAAAMGPGTIAVFEGHRLPVLTAAISPDQHLALSGSCRQLDDQNNCLEGELILWDLVNKQEVRRWNGHTDWIHSAAFTPDGKYAISGSADASLIQWDISTAAPVHEYVGHTDSITSLSISPDGNYLLSGSMDGTIIVWNVESGSLFQIFDGKSGGITSAAFAPDQKSALAATEVGQLILWDINSGQLIRSYAGHTARINAAVISPDGSQILSSSEDLSLRLWDVETGEIIQQQTINCRPNQLGFGQDGNTAFVSCESILFQWNVENWQEKQYYRGHSGFITAFDISSDGRLGITASQDGTLRLWSLNGQFDFKTENTGIREVYAMVVHPDGSHLLLAAESPLLWNVRARQVVRTYAGFQGYIAPGAVAVSPNGRFLAAAGGIWPPEDVRSLMIWDIESGEALCEPVGASDDAAQCCFQPRQPDAAGRISEPSGSFRRSHFVGYQNLPDHSSF
jgi:WD40 repeat protein/DNA-binding SARP family transcriptional activator